MSSPEQSTLMHNPMIQASDNNQYITFLIDKEEYGISVLLVQEIMRYQRLTKINNSNKVIKGVFNFRGNVIPVLDMHFKLGLPPGEYDEFTVIIVVEVGGKTLGMIVDRVSDILSFQPSDVQPVDADFAEDVKTNYLQAIGKTGNKIIQLMNPDKLFSQKEIQATLKQHKESEE